MGIVKLSVIFSINFFAHANESATTSRRRPEPGWKLKKARAYPPVCRIARHSTVNQPRSTPDQAISIRHWLGSSRQPVSPPQPQSASCSVGKDENVVGHQAIGIEIERQLQFSLLHNPSEREIVVVRAECLSAIRALMGLLSQDQRDMMRRFLF